MHHAFYCTNNYCIFFAGCGGGGFSSRKNSDESDQSLKGAENRPTKINVGHLIDMAISESLEKKDRVCDQINISRFVNFKQCFIRFVPPLFVQENLRKIADHFSVNKLDFVDINRNDGGGWCHNFS